MRTIVLFLGLMLGFDAVSQLMTPNMGNRSTDYKSYQEHLEDYRNNYPEEKGQKWLQRWVNFYQSRTDGSGNLVGNTHYLNAAVSVANEKSQFSSSRASDSIWSPEGPDTLVWSPSSWSSHGVARVNCIAFHPTDTHTFWVGVAQGGIWKTTNSGKSYTPLNNNLPILRISDIAVDPLNPDTIYVSVGDYAYLGVALSTDGRKRNTHYGMGVWKSTDGGKTWSATGLSYQQTDFDQSLIRRVFINPNNTQELLAAGISGVWKSNDGGASWTQTLNEIMWDFEQNSENPNSILASSGWISNLGMGNAAIWKSTDFGTSWTQSNSSIVATGVEQRVEITISSDTNLCYAISCDLDRGLHSIYRSGNGGSQWTKLGRYPSIPNVLHWGVGGVNVWGSSDSGQTWDGCSYWLRYYGFTPHADQHYMAYNPLDKKYYLCNDGGIFRTDSLKIGSWADVDTLPGYQFPTKWEDVSSGMQITSFYRVGLSKFNPGFMVAGAQDNGTFYRDTNGHWSNIAGGDGMDCFLDHNDPKLGVVTSQYGNFMRLTNGGTSNASGMRNISGESSEWTTPLIQHPTSGTFYAGAQNVHEYSGFSWVRKGYLPGGSSQPISALDICDSLPRFMIVAKRVNYQSNEMGQVFITDNSGASWREITSGLPDSLYFTSVKIDDREPGMLWVTSGGFIGGVKVYESRDTGRTWVNRSLNLPNIPVNCIEQDEYSGNNALYLGTDVGVYYTNDSLNSWILYSKELPNVIVSDLEMHMVDRRLYASTFGRGIWSVEAIDTVYKFKKLDTSSGGGGNPVGLDQELWKNSEFRIAPNPNSGVFNIQYVTELNGHWDFDLIDVMGRKVMEEKLYMAVEGIVSFDEDLNPGVYYLRISQKTKTKTLRFVVE